MHAAHEGGHLRHGWQGGHIFGRLGCDKTLNNIARLEKRVLRYSILCTRLMSVATSGTGGRAPTYLAGCGANKKAVLCTAIREKKKR